MGGAIPALKSLLRGLTTWLLRYLAWIGVTAFLTLAGALVLMLIKDWTLKSLLASLMVWPMLALGAGGPHPGGSRLFLPRRRLGALLQPAALDRLSRAPTQSNAANDNP